MFHLLTVLRRKKLVVKWNIGSESEGSCFLTEEERNPLLENKEAGANSKPLRPWLRPVLFPLSKLCARGLGVHGGPVLGPAHWACVIEASIARVSSFRHHPLWASPSCIPFELHFGNVMLHPTICAVWREHWQKSSEMCYSGTQTQGTGHTSRSCVPFLDATETARPPTLHLILIEAWWPEWFLGAVVEGWARGAKSPSLCVALVSCCVWNYYTSCLFWLFLEVEIDGTYDQENCLICDKCFIYQGVDFLFLFYAFKNRLRNWEAGGACPPVLYLKDKVEWCVFLDVHIDTFKGWHINVMRFMAYHTEIKHMYTFRFLKVLPKGK